VEEGTELVRKEGPHGIFFRRRTEFAATAHALAVAAERAKRRKLGSPHFTDAQAEFTRMTRDETSPGQTYALQGGPAIAAVREREP